MINRTPIIRKFESFSEEEDLSTKSLPDRPFEEITVFYRKEWIPGTFVGWFVPKWRKNNSTAALVLVDVEIQGYYFNREELKKQYDHLTGELFTDGRNVEDTYEEALHAAERTGRWAPLIFETNEIRRPVPVYKSRRHRPLNPSNDPVNRPGIINEHTS